MQITSFPSVPRIAGEWKVLFRPTQFSSYVNDHTILRAHDGRWHLYGCGQLSESTNPEMERYLVHGSTPSLHEPMTEHRPVIDHGTRAWAPGAIRRGNEYFIYYGPSPTSMARSIDCNHWIGNEIQMIGTPLDAAHRDHMIFPLSDDTWLMYAVGIRDGRGCVSVHVSNDLRQWRFVQYALTTGPAAPLAQPWGAVESPFVVRHEGHWYLFVTYTDCATENYHQTLVFRSANPYDFGSYNGGPPDRPGEADEATLITHLHAHAAEILFDPTTRAAFITTAGWRGKGTPHEGCVSIAPLAWDGV